MTALVHTPSPLSKLYLAAWLGVVSGHSRGGYKPSLLFINSNRSVEGDKGNSERSKEQNKTFDFVSEVFLNRKNNPHEMFKKANGMKKFTTSKVK
jgi:hypothetical protein